MGEEGKSQKLVKQKKKKPQESTLCWLAFGKLSRAKREEDDEEDVKAKDLTVRSLSFPFSTGLCFWFVFNPSYV